MNKGKDMLEHLLEASARRADDADADGPRSSFDLKNGSGVPGVSDVRSIVLTRWRSSRSSWMAFSSSLKISKLLFFFS